MKLTCSPGLMRLGHIYAERFYKAHGASFSGWVVRDNRNQFNYSDPIANKIDAIEVMRSMSVDQTIKE